MNNDWNNLKILTKDEIILFLNQNFYFRTPELRTIKFFKRKIETEKIQKLMKKNLEENDKLKPIAIEIDELAKEFYAEKDFDKRLNILKKRDKLIKIISDNDAERDKLHTEYDDIYKKFGEN